MDKAEVIYECEECNYWEVMHGKGEYRDGQMEKCKNCTRKIRTSAYKEFWGKRAKEDV